MMALVHDALIDAKMLMTDDVYQRIITVDGDFGSIKYKGSLPGKQGEFFGIEWEDVTKGKHSGIFQGQQIFVPTVENSATFIPINSKKIIFKKGFQEALINKYQEAQPDDSVLALGDTDIQVETVGWDKIKQKQFNLSNLEIVGLAGYGVGYCSTSPRVQEICPRIQDLDLSRNLFAEWGDIKDITSGLSELESLRLSFNRLNPLTIDMHGGFDSLKCCILNNTLISWTDLIKVAEFMPVLEELHFGWNNVKKLDSISTFLILKFLEGLKCLKLLNLEHNLLESWEEVLVLKDMSNLEVLYLHCNPIQNISYSEGDFQKLKTLNVHESCLDDWMSVHCLNAFPSLTEIRLKDVPILVNIADVAATLTARLGRVSVLNGSKLSHRRRLDAELWYINQCFKEKEFQNFDNIHPRYNELVKLHGEPVAVPIELSSNILKDRLLVLNLKYKDHNIQKKLTSTFKVKALKMLMNKLFKVNCTNSRIFLMQETWTELDDDWKDLAWYDIKTGYEVELRTD